MRKFPDQADLYARLKKFYYRPPGGESWCDVILRLRSMLDSLSREYPAERPSRGAPMRRSRRGKPRAEDRRRMPARELTSALMRRWPLPVPPPDGDKEDRGRVVVIGGSAKTPGAVLLAATAALRAGAGKLQIAVPRSIATPIGIAIPEALVMGLPESRDGAIVAGAVRLLAPLVEHAQAVLIGPGAVASAQLNRLIRSLLPHFDSATLVLDSEALKCLIDRPGRLHRLRGRAILTPHAGEMATLTALPRSRIERDPRSAAEDFAREARAVVTLKGRDTWIAAPDGPVRLIRTGNVGLGTSGSGDCLSGMIAGLAARGAAPDQAAAWGSYLHGLAGDHLARRRGSLGFLARELLDEIPALMDQARHGEARRRKERP
jgi:hydroxyethylthiazole kinase-like uncharacterized protein yjeF